MREGLSFVDTVEQCSRHRKQTLLGPPDILGPGESSMVGAEGVRVVEVRLRGKIAEDAGFLF